MCRVLFSSDLKLHMDELMKKEARSQTKKYFKSKYVEPKTNIYGTVKERRLLCFEFNSNDL